MAEIIASAKARWIGRMGEETFAAFDAERLAPDRCGRQPSPRALVRVHGFLDR